VEYHSTEKQILVSRIVTQLTAMNASKLCIILRKKSVMTN